MVYSTELVGCKIIVTIMYSATVVCTYDEVQVRREDCNTKSGAHTIDCARGVWGHSPRILHVLKCVLEASEAPFCTCIRTYIPACQLPSSSYQKCNVWGPGQWPCSSHVKPRIVQMQQKKFGTLQKCLTSCDRFVYKSLNIDLIQRTQVSYIKNNVFSFKLAYDWM